MLQEVISRILVLVEMVEEVLVVNYQLVYPDYLTQAEVVEEVVLIDLLMLTLLEAMADQVSSSYAIGNLLAKQ